MDLPSDFTGRWRNGFTQIGASRVGGAIAALAGVVRVDNNAYLCGTIMLVETGNQSHFDSASCLFSPFLVDGSQVRVRCTRLPLQNDLIAGVSSTSASLLVGN